QEPGVGNVSTSNLAHGPPVRLDHVRGEVVATDNQAASHSVSRDGQAQRLELTDLLDVKAAAHHDADLRIAGLVEGCAQPENEGGIDPIEVFLPPGLRVVYQPLVDQPFAGVDANRVQSTTSELAFHGPRDRDRGPDHVVIEVDEAHDLH